MEHLSVEGLSVSYYGRPAISDISLAVDDAQIVAIVGANGAGKTSLLRAISGMVKLSGGHVRYGGRVLDSLEVHQRANLGVGLLPEGRELFGSLSAEENMLLGGVAARKRATKKELDDRLGVVYQCFPALVEKKRARASALSGGQQQMVALGRLLMGLPRVALLDEPSMGLAPRVVNEFGQAIRFLRDTLGISVLLAEQNLHMALGVADLVYGLKLGEIVCQKVRPAGEGEWPSAEVEELIAAIR